MVVLGTAGHVDHGKSSLLRALTHQDPDRLPEEKRRGMTIEPNFLWLDVAGFGRVGVVDVPGHQRFVKNMVTGVAAYGAVLFVVAADDGWMPQSEEHARILHTLGIHRGLIVITKTDLVDGGHLAEVKAEVTARWKAVGLPVVRQVEFSTKDPLSTERVHQALQDLLESHDHAVAGENGGAHLWVDRVFRPTGVGVIVTGTLKQGTIALGDSLWHWPAGEKAIVKSLQVHHRDVDSVSAASRIAMGLDISHSISAGALLTTDRLRSSAYFEARLTFWRAPKKRNFEAAFFFGTARVPGLIIPLGKITGEEWACRVKLCHAVPLRAGDRFLLRSPGADFSWGGGEVVDVRPPRQSKPAATKRLAGYRPGKEGWFEYVGAKAGLVEVSELKESCFTAGSTEQNLCDSIELLRLTAEVGVRLSRWEKVTEPLQAELMGRESSWTAGEVAAAFLRAVGERPNRVSAEAIVSFLEKRGCLIRVGKGFFHPKKERAVSPAERRWREEVLEKLSAAIEPVSFKEWYCAEKPKRELIHQMAREGVVVSLSDDHFLGASQMESFREKVTGLLNGGTGKSTVELKEALGLTRKNAVLILEKLDRDGVTYFKDNLRKRMRSAL